METIVKVATTLRNNWKKSTLAGIGVFYGFKYGKEYYITQQMMRMYCEEAMRYGDMPLPMGSKPRHVTVVLNPASKDGKGHKLYEKYAAPILHLAGLKVSIIKTEYEGQAKDILGVMDNTDAVLIAGGDGTLMEAITGLLRRDDAVTASHRFPIGFIPIGKTNTVSKYLFGNSNLNSARLLAESAMAVIKESVKPVNVMCIQRESGRPVYALAKLEWGAYRNTDGNISKYWYLGPLKTKVAYIFSALKKWPQYVEAEMQTSPPCEGCSNCYNENVIKVADPILPSSSRWWHVFIPKLKKEPEVHRVDYSKIINDQCGTWQSENITSPHISIETDKSLNLQDASDSALNIAIGEEHLPRFQFITNGWKRHSTDGSGNVGYEPLKYAQKIKLIPHIKEGEESWFSIDNENYEASSIDITLLRNRVNIFISS